MLCHTGSANVPSCLARSPNTQSTTYVCCPARIRRYADMKSKGNQTTKGSKGSISDSIDVCMLFIYIYIYIYIFHYIYTIYIYICIYSMAVHVFRLFRVHRAECWALGASKPCRGNSQRRTMTKRRRIRTVVIQAFLTPKNQ